MAGHMELSIVYGKWVEVDGEMGGTELIPAEYYSKEDHGPKRSKILTGWCGQYSASGYMDQTGWVGPYSTASRAVMEAYEMFGDHESAADAREFKAVLRQAKAADAAKKRKS
jgi:hypothetical protein